MATNNEKKLTKLINNYTPGTVYLASGLKELGISHDLQKHYCKSGWLKPVGRGAFKRPHDNINWQGALYSLQIQSNIPVHCGGLTALSLQGFSHFVRQENEVVYLFSLPKLSLPRWFCNYNWPNKIDHIKTSFLPNDLGITDFDIGNFKIKISTPERAFFECIYLTPDKIDLVECYQIAEGLVNLRPGLLQDLLTNCNSVKVKRLFLYISEKLDHQWYDFLELSQVNLGKGHRLIVPKGKYIARYNITIPQELAKL